MADQFGLAKQVTDLVIAATKRAAGAGARRAINLDTLLDDLGLTAAGRASLYAAIREALTPLGITALTKAAFSRMTTIGDIVKAATGAAAVNKTTTKPIVTISTPTKRGRTAKESRRDLAESLQLDKSFKLDKPIIDLDIVLPELKHNRSNVDWPRQFSIRKDDHDAQPESPNILFDRGRTESTVAPVPEQSVGSIIFTPRLERAPEPEATPTPQPAERSISVWIGDGDARRDRALRIGQSYPLNFKVGAAVEGSLTQGPDAAISAADIPASGLATEWLVIAHNAELAAGTPDTAVAEKTIGDTNTWSATFKLLIPESGDSSAPQLKIKPLTDDPKIEVIVNARGEVYRQFKIALTVSDKPDAKPVEPSLVVDELMLTASAHLGLRTTHEWTTPNGVLNITVVAGSMAVVQGYVGGQDVNSIEPWVGLQVLANGPIANAREAAEKLRAQWEQHLDDIDPADLADRLKRWNRDQRPQDGWGLPDWGRPHFFADAAHEARWSKMAVSDELRDLALHGRRLFQVFFPNKSDLRSYVAALAPGGRLNISWTSQAGAGFITHVPWGLMYLGEVPPRGQPIDPMGFLGLRWRISYNSHHLPTGPRSLGALDATHRAHFLYWGDAPGDPTGQEARWQRSQWGGWQNQIFVPQTAQNAKAELLQLLGDPTPAPISLLYLFCQCDTDAGNNPALRFGSTNDPANMVAPLDFGTTALADRPLVFANACSTAAANPYMANELEENFFERECRAFLGTETKVPIAFGSRFATIFFHFFYRLLDPDPMAAGEAVAQTRVFLWTHYRNIGGLFYCYVNQYDLFLARDDEVRALRR